jgi:hypothetical protein
VGLLDDAIREHLDLKRRRGADPSEIERAEREALGPVRRNREPGTGDESEGPAASMLDPAVGSALDEPDEGTASDLAEESYGGAELYDDEPSRGPAVGETYLEEDEAPFEHEEDPFDEEEGFAGGDDPFAEEEDPHRTQLMSTVDTPPPPDDATAVHDVEQSFIEEDVREARPPAEDDRRRDDQPSADRAGDEEEDVLEETPEFLQDTPDHDRLWFEQRPPRDFDFDG